MEDEQKEIESEESEVEVNPEKSEKVAEETETEVTEDAKEESVEEEEKPTEDDDKLELPSGEKVSLNELMAGYMKDADYRRKTAELAKQKVIEQPKQKHEQQNPAPTKSEFLSKYDPQQVEEFQKLAKELGFLSKGEFEEIKTQTDRKTYLDNFFGSHKEYLKENDPNDVRYSALLEELSFYDLSNTKNFPKVLEKAHATVVSKFYSVKERARALAQKERIKTAAVGAGSRGSTSTPKEDTSKYSPEQIEIMREVGVWGEK